jgi:hypothetical protein
MEEETEIVVVAGSGDREAAERCSTIIGTRARVLIVDGLGEWQDVSLVPPPDEVLWCGLDLARGHDLHAEITLRDFRIRMSTSDELLSTPRRTHPTTARELRRAERGRRR